MPRGNIPPIYLVEGTHNFLKVHPNVDYLVRDAPDEETANDWKKDYAGEIRKLGGFVGVPTTQAGAMSCDLFTSDKIKLLRLVPMEPPPQNATTFTMIGGQAPPSCQHGYWCTSVFAPGYKFWVRYFSIWKINPTGGNSTLDQQYMVYAQRL